VSTSGKYRNHSSGFKEQAVRMVLAEHRRVTEVALVLGARKNKNKISTFRTSCLLTYRDLMPSYPSRPSKLRKNIPLA